MENSIISNFLDKIRNENVNEYTMGVFIKKNSDEYDNALLKAMTIVVDEYLALNGAAMALNLSDRQKETVLKKRKKSGLPVLYIDIYEGMDVQQRESTERLMTGKNLESIIDWERLVYPHEFVDIYKFKSLILEIIKSKTLPVNQIEQSNTIDLSDSNRTEKIIILEKLGILNFLKEKEPFINSTNALASVISGFTGINVRTVQSYINPIDNSNVIQNNNPLEKEKTVNKVMRKLTSIGFIQSE